MRTKDTVTVVLLSLVLGAGMTVALNREETASWITVRENPWIQLAIYLGLLLLLAWAFVLRRLLPRGRGGAREEWLVSRGGGEPKRFDPARYGNFRRIGRNADGCTYMDNTGTIIMTRFGRADGGGGSASLPGAAECLMLCLLAGAVFTAVNQLVDWTAPGGPVPDGALVRRLLVRSGAVGEDVRFLTARLAEGGGRLGGRLADLWQQLAAAFQQVRSLW